MTPILGCNNLSVKSLPKNTLFLAHKKHIDVRYHYIKEVLKDCLITLIEINS